MARVNAREGTTEDLTEQAAACRNLLGRRILSERGTEIGLLQDIDFDPESGQSWACSPRPAPFRARDCSA
ncbi:hypothetical protein [Streptomyces sp. 11x1]|uniref:PRC-barrel domain-containing protein n=1 Tax=Streptomyces sp. 11x1 TaxID=3038642 RepID=UPI00292E320C|nr:hypothetical protein [Streptomyces sp. 11x1]WNZ06472.1 hypothetical protein P8T65_01940 [Streptomyces sp. 11x1]